MRGAHIVKYLIKKPLVGAVSTFVVRFCFAGVSAKSWPSFGERWRVCVVSAKARETGETCRKVPPIIKYKVLPSIFQGTGDR